MSGSAQLQLRQGDVIAKKFEVESALGSGPEGTSYVCRTLANGKKCVVKLLAGPDVGDRLANDMVSRLREVPGDSVVKVLDTGEHAGHRWMAMEHLEGESLRRLMDEFAGQKKPFSLQDACQIIARVLEAADAAHQRGLIHRHLKPQNVLVHTRAVGPGGGRALRTIKITGLGFSDLIHPGVLQEGLTARAADTRYMAPELSSPSQGGNAQSDVYSAGIMFYELLCGQTPMGTYLPPTRIRDDLPKHVDDIVDMAIAANGEDRYPTARDMINDIQRAFQDDDKPVAGMSRRALAAVIGATLAVIVVVTAVLLVTDPVKQARNADDQMRADVAKKNPLPPKEVVEAKLKGHEDMVYIPSGTFIKGRMRAETIGAATEPPAAEQALDGYYVDRFEWENVKGANPSVNVTWQQADDLCKARGKRLCTADEWERACKDPENRIYSYGDAFSGEKCGADVVTDTTPRDERADRPSGELAECVSGWGVYDMSGGAREWTGTQGSSAPKFRVIKGGKAGEGARGSRCAFEDDRSPMLTDRSISFRCCMSDDGSTASPAGEGSPATGGAAPEGVPAEGGPSGASTPAGTQPG